MEPIRDLTSAEALDRLRGARRTAEIAEARALEFAVTYAELNGPRPGQEVARLDQLHDVPLAGDGAPSVQEDAIAELAVALRMSAHAARSYLGDALEIAHRLPRLWRRVRKVQVPTYRARMVAAKTHHLSPKAAAYVDAKVAPIAHKVGPTRLMQLVDEAITLHDHEQAAARAAAAAEQRHVSVYTRQPVDGQVDMVARLDHADALELEAALAAVAEELRAAGDPGALDVRRAKALGVLARRHLVGQTVGHRVQLYVHVDAETYAAGTARIEQGNVLATLDQVSAWCATAGTSVRVTPVIDLNDDLARQSYGPGDLLIEQTVLRSVTCAHPFCERSARRADIDHILAWLAGGASHSLNLAPLCRFHHRIKTHSSWEYEQLRPGVYLWRSPRGRRFGTTRHGTDELPP